jgi:integrase
MTEDAEEAKIDLQVLGTHAMALGRQLWPKSRLSIWAFCSLPIRMAKLSSMRHGADIGVSAHTWLSLGGKGGNRAIIVQKKTGTPVQLEITEQTRRAAGELIRRDQVAFADDLFRSRLSMSAHLTTRQYARIVQGWVRSIGLNPATYGTHSLRRTKAA